MKAKRSKAKIRAERNSIAVPCKEPAQELQVLRPDAAGIDCGAQEHYIAVPPDRVSAGEPTVRRFSAFTEGLDAAVEWLKACRVSTVAMEATGVYWIPLHQKLETAGLEVYLGDYRAEHLFVLSQSLQAYRFYQARIEECDRELEPLLQKLAQQVEVASARLKLDALKAADPQQGVTVSESRHEKASAGPLKTKRKRKPRANEPKIELAGLLERICGIDLTKVVGLNALNVLLIVSEIGVDMCSWLGLCPSNKISGGKVLDSHTRQVVNRVADALRLAAQSAGRTETCLGIFYRRKQAHLGAPKATTATARKLAWPHLSPAQTPAALPGT